MATATTTTPATPDTTPATTPEAIEDDTMEDTTPELPAEPFEANALVTVALPAGRTLDGRYVEVLEDGRISVAYMKGNQELTTKAHLDKVSLREAPPAPATPAVLGAGGLAPGKRPPLPATHLTPVGLTNEINERKLYNGGVGTLRSQAMYSYIKNAPMDHPFPLENIAGRDCVEIEAGIAWWIEKDARVAARAEAAAAKRNAVPSTEARDAKAALRRSLSASGKANEAFDKYAAKLEELQAKVDALRSEAINAAAAEYWADQELAATLAAAQAPAEEVDAPAEEVAAE